MKFSIRGIIKSFLMFGIPAILELFFMIIENIQKSLYSMLHVFE